ncbi:MAG TPA: ABC transporter ATP-binding protein, partial [Gammaproteobacteria bacterium]|nr:ABC transporter ATP-binding protein [Gammaproteobacteria bacterium]
REIGLVFQESALDRSLTVQENLDFTAALYNLSPARIAGRVDELLGLFGLTERRDTQVAHLSGGMRRALDIIRGVLHRPRILLLDEPTIGLDVLNRRFIWRYLERLREEEGMTVLLTTHYLEEAEPCDWVTFLREGRAIGSGTPTEMLGAIGAYILEVTGAEEGLIEELRTRLGDPVQEGDRHLFRVRDPDTPLGDLEAVLRPRVRSILVRQPDLNDVYIWLNRSRTEGFGA